MGVASDDEGLVAAAGDEMADGGVEGFEALGFGEEATVAAWWDIEAENADDILNVLGSGLGLTSAAQLGLSGRIEENGYESLLNLLDKFKVKENWCGNRERKQERFSSIAC